MAWLICRGPFLRTNRAHKFPLPVEAEVGEVLTHLKLLDEGRPTHAAVLLFAHQRQRFMLPTELKRAHFHGTDVAKPIPSHHVYKGTVFELVDQAIDFVMSKINWRVGTRQQGPEAPVQYEIPRDVVAEAIVNAIAHRDYRSTTSVQVMLFADRLEVWNPGTLPPARTLDKLRGLHGSFPGNPLLAEPLYPKSKLNCSESPGGPTGPSSGTRFSATPGCGTAGDDPSGQAHERQAAVSDDGSRDGGRSRPRRLIETPAPDTTAMREPYPRRDRS